MLRQLKGSVPRVVAPNLSHGGFERDRPGAIIRLKAQMPEWLTSLIARIWAMVGGQPTS